MKLTEPTFAEHLARRFHEIYEEAAPRFDYKPRSETSVPWEDVPENNKRLMIYVARQIEDELRHHVSASLLAAKKRAPKP